MPLSEKEYCQQHEVFVREHGDVCRGCGKTLATLAREREAAFDQQVIQERISRNKEAERQRLIEIQAEEDAQIVAFCFACNVHICKGETDIHQDDIFGYSCPHCQKSADVYRDGGIVLRTRYTPPAASSDDDWLIVDNGNDHVRLKFVSRLSRLITDLCFTIEMKIFGKRKSKR